jgi:hypothetical protein
MPLCVSGHVSPEYSNMGRYLNELISAVQKEIEYQRDPKRH